MPGTGEMLGRAGLDYYYAPARHAVLNACILLLYGPLPAENWARAFGLTPSNISQWLSNKVISQTPQLP